MPDKRPVVVRCKCGQPLAIREIEPIETDKFEALQRKLWLEGWKRFLLHAPDGCGSGKPYTADDLFLLESPQE
jgi:hypothetical protein